MGVNADFREKRPEATGSILVVDDEPVLAEYLCRLLAVMGFQANAVFGGREALLELARRRYDAILCDIHMPGMNGVALYHRIREQDPALARRMLFMTADPDDPGVVPLIREHGCVLLHKPLTADRLHEALDRLLAPKPSRRDPR